MSLGGVVLRGVQRPRVELVPPAAAAAGAVDAGDAVDLAAGYGLRADEWQAYVLGGWLGRRNGGRWASTRCGLAVPRQNGKNGVIEIRELFGMVLLGERILHTAHEVKTARKAFKRLQHFFGSRPNDPAALYPQLNSLVAEVRNTNGQEALVLRSGASVEFIARSKGSGRGFTVDLLVCDEAQQLSDESLSALLFTISAAPLGNPQQIYAGTPPSESMNGEVWTRIRRAALAGEDARLCWHEWSNPDDVDPDDMDAAALANPSLGAGRESELSVESIEDERTVLDVRDFLRERYGVWSAQTGVGGAVDMGAWRALEDAGSGAVELAAFGLAVSLNREWSAVGAAGLRDDGAAHVELVERRRGVEWVVRRCVELDEAHEGATFVVDGVGPAARLVEPLLAAGLTVVVASSRDVGAGCAWMVDAITEGVVWHGPQPELDEAVAGAKRRNIGDGMFAFGRRASGVDICAWEAVTLACHLVPRMSMCDAVTADWI